MILKITRAPHIPLTLRKKIGKLCKPLTGTVFRINVFGQLYEGKTGSHMDNKIFQYGLHESATVRLMRNILQWQRDSGEKPVLMDIGTNAGFHLLCAASLADKAYGFEPWTPVRDRAQHNLTLNNITHTAIMPFGLSDTDADLPFTPPDGNNFGVGSFAVQDSQNTVSLPVRHGDPFVQEHNIEPTLLKIDVEGFEKNVLTGLQDTIRSARPAIIFEYSSLSRRDFDRPDQRDTLFGKGYFYYGIKRSREYPRLTPFVPGKKYENILAWPDAALPQNLLA